MKVIRNINNNVSICVDGNNRQVVVFGKGVGFIKPPNDIALSKIEQTFYNIDESTLEMLSNIDENIINIAKKIIDYARRLISDKDFSVNVVLTLSDHISFAIERQKKNMNIKLPIVYDIQYLFNRECEVGKYALDLIKKDLFISLPQEEVSYIALHLINAEIQEDKEIDDEKVIDNIASIVSRVMEIEIDRTSFNFSRFTTHIYYLLKRCKNKEQLQTENEKMYESLIDNYPKTHDCIKSIAAYFKSDLNIELSDEEKLYMMLHVNRLYQREEYK